MEKIYEIVRIKQIVKENDEGLKLRQIRGSDDAVAVASTFIADEDREVFLVMCLNTKNQVNTVHRCHVGNLNSTIASVRDIFKTAILSNAMSIIVSHVHPSGDPTPSVPDIEVTKRLKEAGELMEIQLLDHIIIGGNTGRYISLREKGYM